MATDFASASTALHLNIGSRRSVLALKQTEIVEIALKKAWPEYTYEVHVMSTMGDKDQKTALYEMGANSKSLWTYELEELLLERKLDLIVHSLKDMPTQLPPSLTIGAILPREDPRDAFILPPRLPPTTTFATLPPGSCIGTSSVRRTAQLRRKYPHLTFKSVRGNVGTRLSKLDDPENGYSALVLAAAGLIRLGMEHRISRYLSSDEGDMLHAVGQGAIGVEIREGDETVRRLLSAIACERTTRACIAERSLLRTLEGGCSVPIGVETDWITAVPSVPQPVKTPEETAEGAPQLDTLSRDLISASSTVPGQHEQLRFRTVVVSIDGTEFVDECLIRSIPSRDAADEFGREMAQALLKRGADKILENINLNRKAVED